MRYLLLALLISGCGVYGRDKPGRTVWFVDLTVCQKTYPQALYECAHFDSMEGEVIEVSMVVDPVHSYIHHVARTEKWRGSVKVMKGGRLAVCDRDSEKDPDYTCTVWNAHRKISHYSESVERPPEKYMNQ